MSITKGYRGYKQELEELKELQKMLRSYEIYIGRRITHVIKEISENEKRKDDEISQILNQKVEE